MIWFGSMKSQYLSPVPGSLLPPVGSILTPAIGQDLIGIAANHGEVDLQSRRIGLARDPFELRRGEIEVGGEFFRCRVAARFTGELVFRVERQPEPIGIVLEFRLVFFGNIDRVKSRSGVELKQFRTIFVW